MDKFVLSICDSETKKTERGLSIMKQLYKILIIVSFLPLPVSQSVAQEVKINDNLVVEADGTLRMDSSATVWNDIMVYPDATTREGSKPPVWGTVFRNDAGNTSTGVYLWKFSPNQEQELHFSVQIPHNYKEGSDLYPHVHWTSFSGTPSGSDVVWGLEYTMVSMGEVFPATHTLVTNSVHPDIGTPSGTGQHLVSEFGTISGSGLKISAILICRLYRIAGHSSDTFPGDVGFLGFDIHYEQDTQGSRNQWIK